MSYRHGTGISMRGAPRLLTLLCFVGGAFMNLSTLKFYHTCPFIYSTSEKLRLLSTPPPPRLLLGLQVSPHSTVDLTLLLLGRDHEETMVVKQSTE